jgi:hypothetical protein
MIDDKTELRDLQRVAGEAILMEGECQLIGSCYFGTSSSPGAYHGTSFRVNSSG